MALVTVGFSANTLSFDLWKMSLVTKIVQILFDIVAIRLIHWQFLASEIQNVLPAS